VLLWRLYRVERGVGLIGLRLGRVVPLAGVDGDAKGVVAVVPEPEGDPFQLMATWCVPSQAKRLLTAAP